jgi:hypothetical protein
VDILTEQLEDTKAIGLAPTELYVRALGQFGGVTSSLPPHPSAYNIFSWMKSNFTKLLDFVGVAVDFGALSAAMDFSKMLAQLGCTDTEGLKEVIDIESLTVLGETS